LDRDENSAKLIKKIELRKWGWFYVTQKSPGIEEKRSLPSNGTPLTVWFVRGAYPALKKK